jgi:hypothetical protein
MKSRLPILILKSTILLTIAACHTLHATAPSSEEIKFFGLPSDCEKNVPQLDTGDQVTLMYHWTDNPLAATDPWAYVSGTIAAGLEMNKKDLKPGLAGNGLYLASDPFSSMNFGHILLTVAIKAHQKVANWQDALPGETKMSIVDVIRGHGCTEIAYSYISIYKPNRALVLTSSRIIDISRRIDALNLPATPDSIPGYEKFLAHPTVVAPNATLREYLTQLEASGIKRFVARSLYLKSPVPEFLYVPWARSQVSLNSSPENNSTYDALRKSPYFNQSGGDVHSFIAMFWGSELEVPVPTLQGYFKTLGWDLSSATTADDVWAKARDLLNRNEWMKGFQSLHDYPINFGKHEEVRSISIWK